MILVIYSNVAVCTSWHAMISQMTWIFRNSVVRPSHNASIKQSIRTWGTITTVWGVDPELTKSSQSSMTITQIPFFHFTNWLHFLSCPACRPVTALTKVSHYKLTRRKISNNLAPVLYSYLFLLFVSLQIQCQKSHEMESLQGIGPVTTWWNLMEDCEYRTCFFPLQFASFNQVLVKCKYPFRSVFYCFPSLTECQVAPFWGSIPRLWRALLPLYVGLKWLIACRKTLTRFRA